ncbi:hypothetical protein EMIHUDRAFT_458248 [Emiliania huxleyi CCMP1516]|uniref:Uncharacterized protein n=2 Tax=Emiliania huxleyi TaxID=2903 RepID=A0A0D3JER9_EMIH1|nr:hypothetical protein EMIHUDRAFT_458248 [Emiliania huxleyi CCMP1516]EOD22004.1 hypothetical protein EMIHUDRAFT_458248 [Emiliania huxleyi CCMP1516]|eukprot:XP_005774433.1 hypothetical protein EMIHUDRAFT_458248 [Emiliania huxleyi CCMP1516]
MSVRRVTYGKLWKTEWQYRLKALAEKAEAKARQKERVAAIVAGTDAAGAGAGVEEALNCWEEGAYEAETLETLAEFVRRDESDEHNAESWIDLLHACSSCKSFITDAGDGSLLEAVSEDMLARLLPSPYYRSAQPIARSAFGALSRSLSPCDLCYMGPTGRGQPCKRKYVSSALRAVDLHLKSVLTAANGAYLLQHRWLRHMGIGARESRLLRLRAGRREEAMRLRVLSDRTAGLAGRWWAFAALCESHFILADYPQQMAIPLHRPLSYDLSYDPPHSDPPEAATRLGAAARLETAAPREARPRDRIVFETLADGVEAGEAEAVAAALLAEVEGFAAHATDTPGHEVGEV